jgi:thioester reductase-like protein
LKAHLVSPEDVPYLWEDVAPMLARVTEHSEGELETDDFLESLMIGGMQLWVATEDNEIIMSMVTMIVPYPQKKVLRVVSISGERFKELHEKFNDMIEAFAIKKGCSALELWGRKGWKKMLPDWKDSYIVFTKDLKERMH